MNVSTKDGIVPRNADVLMLGVKPGHFDHFQRMLKGDFQSAHMGWNYVANLGKSFDDVINRFLPNRPELDVVYFTNQVGLSPDELRSETTKLTFELAKHPAKPWVVLGQDVAWTRHLFQSRRITVQYPSIEIAMSERYKEKCRIAQQEAA